MFRGQSFKLPFKTIYPDAPWKSQWENKIDREYFGVDDHSVAGPVCYTTGPGYPSPTDTYIPFDLSGRVRVGWSRNPARFHFPKYWQYVESPRTNGYYLKITSQEAARVVTVQDFQWPDGDPDRSADTGTESFNFINYLTNRNSYKYRLGDKAANQAVWPIVEQHTGIKASQCMTARSVRGLTVATTTSNWTQASDTANLSADHTDAAASIPGVGGYLDQGTSVAPFLKLALGYIADLINQDTLGVIDSEPDRFFMVINPKVARQLASSPEIHDYIKGSYWAKEEIMKGAHPNGKYGLPSSIYGFNVIVENCVQITNRKGATRTSQYAMPNQNILICSRVGELEGIYGAPSFSTLTMFWYQDEMTTELKKDNWDRLTYGRVIEDTNEQVTATASGFLITAATSS